LADTVLVRLVSLMPIGISLAMMLSCSPDLGPTEETRVVFDGQSQTINGPVTCTSFPDGELVILATGASHNTVRVLLRRENRIVVEKVGIRIGNLSGYTDDLGDMWAIKVDDAYDINGRMPPNAGENGWHDFEVDVTCRYETPSTNTRGPFPPPPILRRW
jgi:hypothetical protein